MIVSFEPGKAIQIDFFLVEMSGKPAPKSRKQYFAVTSEVLRQK